MKYTEAWSSIVSQNLNLKVTSFILGAISMILGLTTLRLTFKDSIVIERGCYTNLANKVEDKHTVQEIEAFIKISLSQRFDSQVQPTDGLLAIDELNLRSQEQKDFSSRGFKQNIIIGSVAPTEQESQFKVDADRIIAVGEVRSAFRFPLLVKLESKARSSSNPYGLLVASITQVDKEAKSKKDKK
jgi:hypothetical protein